MHTVTNSHTLNAKRVRRGGQPRAPEPVAANASRRDPVLALVTRMASADLTAGHSAAIRKHVRPSRASCAVRYSITSPARGTTVKP